MKRDKDTGFFHGKRLKSSRQELFVKVICTCMKVRLASQALIMHVANLINARILYKHWEDEWQIRERK